MRYRNAVPDPDTGAWISDSEVADTTFAATKNRITARLLARRVRDASELPTAAADIFHGRHAIIEAVFADLIDGPVTYMPSG
jgi:hypothetical protein